MTLQGILPFYIPMTTRSNITLCQHSGGTHLANIFKGDLRGKEINCQFLVLTYIFISSKEKSCKRMYNNWEMPFDFILPSDQFTVYFTWLSETGKCSLCSKASCCQMRRLTRGATSFPKAQKEISCLDFVFFVFFTNVLVCGSCWTHRWTSEERCKLTTTREEYKKL